MMPMPSFPKYIPSPHTVSPSLAPSDQLEYVGNKLKPSPTFPMDTCEEDCDSDDDGEV